MRAHERAQAGVAGEMAVDRLRVGVEIEQPPHAGDEVHEPVDRGKVRAQSQRLLARDVPHLDHAGRAVDVGDAPVHVRVEVDGFDAGNRPRREERQQRAPRQRRTVRNAQLEPAVDHEPVGLPAASRATRSA